MKNFNATTFCPGSARASRAVRRALAPNFVRTIALKFKNDFRAHEPTTRASLAAREARALPCVKN